jgi:hypothetical protein
MNEIKFAYLNGFLICISDQTYLGSVKDKNIDDLIEELYGGEVPFVTEMGQFIY